MSSAVMKVDSLKSRIGILLFGGLFLPSIGMSQEITGAGPYRGPGGFDRGMQSTMHCGNNPESWVRGSAWLDKGTGAIRVTVQLETDSTRAGPKGVVRTIVKDGDGHGLATADSSEVGIGGKPPGRATINNFNSNAQIPPDVASKAASLYVEAQCTGSIGRLWNITLGDAQQAFKLGVTVLSGGK